MGRSGATLLRTVEPVLLVEAAEAGGRASAMPLFRLDAHERAVHQKPLELTPCHLSSITAQPHRQQWPHGSNPRFAALAGTQAEKTRQS